MVPAADEDAHAYVLYCTIRMYRQVKLGKTGNRKRGLPCGSRVLRFLCVLAATPSPLGHAHIYPRGLQKRKKKDLREAGT